MTKFFSLLKIEMLLLKRNAVGFILGIGLPVMIFLLMSTMLANNYSDDLRPKMVSYILISMTIYSSISFAIYSFPLLFVEDRNSNWLKFVERSPIKMWQYYLVKVIRIVINFFIAVIVVFIVGKVVKNVSFTLEEWLISGLIILFGATSMLSMGFVLTLLKSAEKVSLVGNILFIFLSMIGGLWWPLESFPNFLQKIGKLTPTYHVNNMANSYLNNKDFATNSFFILIAYAIILLVITLLLRKKIK